MEKVFASLSDEEDDDDESYFLFSKLRLFLPEILFI